ncbi:hypothetical protein PENTCL1PPCAC_29451, partial [Pristionchus entomophagus]
NLVETMPSRHSPVWKLLAGMALLCSLLSLFTPQTVFRILAFLALACSRWALFTLRRILSSDPLPPGPITWPLAGSLPDIDPCEPQRTLLELKRTYGPIFTLTLPAPTVVICDYEALRKASTLTETSARPDSYLYTIFLKNKEEGNGMILSSGRTWKTARNFTNKHFDSFGVMSDQILRNIEFHAAIMAGIIEQSLEKEGNVLNLHRTISYTVASIIYEIVLGRRYDISDKKMWLLKELLDGVLANVQSVQMLCCDNYPFMKNVLPADKEYRRLGFELQEFFRGELELNRKQMALEEATNNNEGEGKSDIHPHNLCRKYLDDPEGLVNGDMDLILLAGDIWTGGMETTLTATRWAIIFFTQNPEVQEVLHEEIMRRYPRRSNGQFSYSTRHELPYLCAVLDEVLRLANVLPWNIPHRAVKTFSLNGHTIKEGTNIMFSYSSLHHDETHFPDPLRFNPERFLRRTPTENEAMEWAKQGRDLGGFAVYEKNPLLSPFGMGQRRCPGEQLALKEIFVFLITLVQRFRFVTDESNPPDTRRCMGMTSVPKEYVVRVEKREDWYSD